ncbi:hypothetical protein ALC60_07615, partial [Trachymyrmex zeteki]
YPHPYFQELQTCYNTFYILRIFFVREFIYVYKYIHTYIHTYVHTYVHTYIHTNIHTYIHTYIHIYMYYREGKKKYITSTFTYFYLKILLQPPVIYFQYIL